MFDIDELFDNAERESYDSYDITFESECCPCVRENAIWESIAEYERMNEWD